MHVCSRLHQTSRIRACFFPSSSPPPVVMLLPFVFWLINDVFSFLFLTSDVGESELAISATDRSVEPGDVESTQAEEEGEKRDNMSNMHHNNDWRQQFCLSFKYNSQKHTWSTQHTIKRSLVPVSFSKTFLVCTRDCEAVLVLVLFLSLLSSRSFLPLVFQ